MRKIAIVIALLAGAGCGNWSNQDLVFLAALPDRVQLESKLPGTQVSSSQSTLTQPLIGNEADGYKFTTDAARAFNGGLYSTLDLLETVRTFPPTKRKTDERIWGPWRSARFPKLFVQVVMDRKSCHVDADKVRRCDDYTYDLEMGPSRRGTFTPVLTGTWNPTGTIRDGNGSLTFTVSAMRSLGADPVELRKVNQIDVTYQTSPYPITVDMTIDTTTAGSQIDYHYLEVQSGAGAMHFSTKADVVPGPGIENIDVRSGWVKGGAGEATLAVTGGDSGAGATKDECWDASGLLVYDTTSWNGVTEGDQAKCPASVPSIP